MIEIDTSGGVEACALDVEYQPRRAIGGGGRRYVRVDMQARQHAQHLQISLEGFLAQWTVFRDVCGDGADLRRHVARTAVDLYVGDIAFHHDDVHVAVGEILRGHIAERERVTVRLVDGADFRRRIEYIGNV